MPDFERKHIKLISELSKEAIIGTESYDEYDRKGWFLYFWKEARGEAGFYARSRQILPFFNEMFHLPGGWDKDVNALDPGGDFMASAGMLDYKSGAVRVDALTPKKRFDEVTDRVLLDLLKACLDVGFQKIPVRAVDGGLGNVTRPDMAFARHGLILDENHKYSIGWRGDTRSFEELSRAGGFLPKADSDQTTPQSPVSYAEKINLRAPWHPFNDPAIRQHYYYRKMQQDNCLHSVVSITLDFITAASFPKIEDKVSGWLKGGMLDSSATIDNPPQEIAKQLCEVRIGGRKVRRIVDKNRLFLVILFGGFFDTQTRQSGNPFPEVAVKRIPANNIVGALSYYRVCHGLRETDGFTVFVDARNCVLPDRDKCIALTGDRPIGRNLWRAVNKQYWDIWNMMPFRACWTGSGGKRMTDPLRLDSTVIWGPDRRIL